ncbi:MAG: glycosyltransferase, partial [Acetatifactor sp.]|nr:glycosyltransferase [Acetatifactor sp.]
ERSISDYAADISFVGSLYNEKEKWLQAEGIPEYVRGYLEGIEEAQIRIYGYNFVKEMIDEQVARDILQKADLLLNDLYFDNPVQLVADLVNWEISQKERIRVIERLAGQYPIHLYTQSPFEAGDNIKLCGAVDYQREMPLVFHNSKINLQITSKTIETGISQRVLDILACGGFCLANYQPEIAEYFEDGKELVMYTDMEDLVRKADWYLKHDEERVAIARAGCEKVREQFSMKDRLAYILETVEENWNG